MAIMLTEDIRKTATNALDGIRVNRDKFAQDVISLCGQYDRMHTAYAELQRKAATMEAELNQLRRAGSSNSKSAPLPPEFAEIFKGFASGKKGDLS